MSIVRQVSIIILLGPKSKKLVRANLSINVVYS